MNRYQGDKALMAEYMISTYNEAILNNELPMKYFRSPLLLISLPEEEKKDPNKLEFNPKTLQEEIILFIRYNEDACKMLGMSYFDFCNLHFDEWEKITKMILDHKNHQLEMKKQQNKISERSLREMEARRERRK